MRVSRFITKVRSWASFMVLDGVSAWLAGEMREGTSASSLAQSQSEGRNRLAGAREEGIEAELLGRVTTV